MKWEEAKDHCLNLNTDAVKRTNVEARLQEREDQLDPLRQAFYHHYSQRTIEEEEHIRDKSAEFGPIGGCYLPSREELEQQAIDKGSSTRDNSRYEDEIFSDSEDSFWSSSGYAGNANAFGFHGHFGMLQFEDDEDEKSVRCVCDTASR